MKNHEIYLYDEIVTEKYTDWDDVEHGFCPNDLGEVLRNADKGDVVSIYVNSPGGSVFAAVAMASEIKRAKARGVKVDAYVDGIAASAASFLIMACDTVYMFDGTMLMVHKPSSWCIGNADDFLKAAEQLESIESGTCMPIYREKLKGDEEELKALIAHETWMSTSQAAEMFDIVLIDEKKDVKSVLTGEMIAKYHYQNAPGNLIVKDNAAHKHMEPDEMKGDLDQTAAEVAPETVDLSQWEERISKLGR